MFKAGDVVLGKFATKSGRVLDPHYSVVMQVFPGAVLLAYTTSMKEGTHNSNPATRFTAEDMKLANWLKPCLWNAGQTCLVTNDDVRKVGSITKATLGKMQMAYQRAKGSRTLETVLLQPDGKVVTA